MSPAESGTDIEYIFENDMAIQGNPWRIMHFPAGRVAGKCTFFNFLINQNYNTF